jgi:hypothetical protein
MPITVERPHSPPPAVMPRRTRLLRGTRYGAAYHLAPDNQVSLFEIGARLGGHARNEDGRKERHAGRHWIYRSTPITRI